jgi:hypothetical protein
MFWYSSGFWRLRLGIAGLVLGGMLLFAGFREWQLGSASSAQPEDLTLEALIARGPDGNANVRVSDFVLGDNYVYFTDESGIYWTSILVPAMPKTMGDQSSHVLIPKVIVKSKHVANEDQLDALHARVQLQGMVINRIEELGSEEKEILLKDYPGIDFTKCIILEEGRQPSDSAMLFLMGGGGLALLLGGGGLLLYNSSRTY